MISAEIIKYKNVGFTMIGLPNVVNSIQNIETIISKQIISVSELILAKKNKHYEKPKTKRQTKKDALRRAEGR